ncbi:MAG: sterol desaturase family protein [Rhizomicrobium sp.]
MLNAILSLANRDPASFQCSLFALCFMTLWFFERRAHGETFGAKTKHSAINTAFMLSALPIQLTLIAICLRFAAYVSAHHIGLVWLLPGAHNGWARIALTFVMLDFLDYAYHYLAHNVPFLWRFHLVHHSDRDVDVSTTFREHPGETLIRVSFLILWVGLTGASVGVLSMRQTFETFANL